MFSNYVLENHMTETAEANDLENSKTHPPKTFSVYMITITLHILYSIILLWKSFVFSSSN